MIITINQSDLKSLEASLLPLRGEDLNGKPRPLTWYLAKTNQAVVAAVNGTHLGRVTVGIERMEGATPSDDPWVEKERVVRPDAGIVCLTLEPAEGVRLLSVIDQVIPPRWVNNRATREGPAVVTFDPQLLAAVLKSAAALAPAKKQRKKSGAPMPTVLMRWPDDVTSPLRIDIESPALQGIFVLASMRAW